jgi:triosephosphate isomerase
MSREPVALANWKMEMTIAEGLAFLRRFQTLAADQLAAVQVILCPPYTTLQPMALALRDSPIELGAQNLSIAAGGAYTGQISARLAADAGARWAQLGHWELRRHLGETDDSVNRKLHRALEADLNPILFIGEPSDADHPVERNASSGGAVPTHRALDRQLASILADCDAGQIGRIVFFYEPEWTIGVAEPAPPEHIAAGCRTIRQWLAAHVDQDTARCVRIAYGGSVTPAYARDLLALPDLDGLGAGRIGRDPVAFAELVRLIHQARPWPA